jgi:hypothetical protein
MSAKGTVAHIKIENIINKTTEPRPLPDLPPEYNAKMEEEVSRVMGNLEKWRQSTKVDLSHAEAEVKYEMPLPLGYVISRGIDLLTPEWIIDFKSGKSKQSEHRYDVVISKRMVESAGHGPRKMMIVYLGGDEPEEYEMYSKGKHTTEEEDMGHVEELLQGTIANREMIRTGHDVAATFDGGLCGMCSYRHVCNGV